MHRLPWPAEVLQIYLEEDIDLVFNLPRPVYNYTPNFIIHFSKPSMYKFLYINYFKLEIFHCCSSRTDVPIIESFVFPLSICNSSETKTSDETSLEIALFKFYHYSQHFHAE